MFFYFNGVSSVTQKLTVRESNHLAIPNKYREFIKVDGRQDDLVIEDGTREMVELEIECVVDGRPSTSLASLGLALDTWLNGTSGYRSLTFDDGSEFHAIHVGQLDITELVNNFGELTLKFRGYRIKELNMFDSTKAVQGKKIDATTNGEVTDTNYFISDYIPVVAGGKYAVTGLTNTKTIWTYNSSKVYNSKITTHDNITGFTTASPIAFIRISSLKTEMPNVLVFPKKL